MFLKKYGDKSILDPLESPWLNFQIRNLDHETEIIPYKTNQNQI